MSDTTNSNPSSHQQFRFDPSNPQQRFDQIRNHNEEDDDTKQKYDRHIDGSLSYSIHQPPPFYPNQWNGSPVQLSYGGGDNTPHSPHGVQEPAPMYHHPTWQYPMNSTGYDLNQENGIDYSYTMQPQHHQPMLAPPFPHPFVPSYYPYQNPMMMMNPHMQHQHHPWQFQPQPYSPDPANSFMMPQQPPHSYYHYNATTGPTQMDYQTNEMVNTESPPKLSESIQVTPLNVHCNNKPQVSSAVGESTPRVKNQKTQVLKDKTNDHDKTLLTPMNYPHPFVSPSFTTSLPASTVQSKPNHLNGSMEASLGSNENRIAITSTPDAIQLKKPQHQRLQLPSSRRLVVLKPSSILAVNPLELPSPFTKTHTLLPNPIILLKQNPTESFGVTLCLIAESTLMPLPVTLPRSEIILSATDKITGTILDGKAEPKAMNGKLKSDTVTTTAQTSNFITLEAKGNENVMKESKIVEYSRVSATESTINETKFTLLGDDTATPTPTKIIISPSTSSETEGTIVTKSERRPRRKRAFYFVMIVTDTTIQNNRADRMKKELQNSKKGESGKEILKTKSNVSPEPSSVLQKGDIILSINGLTTAGLSFTSACQLFKTCNLVDEDGWIRCPIVAARINPPPEKPKPKEKKPLTVSSVKLIALRLPLKEKDFSTLATSMLLAAMHLKQRKVGLALTDDEIQSHISLIDPTLSILPISLILKEWTKVEKQVREMMFLNGTKYWESRNLINPAVKPSTDKKVFLTDAEISAIRYSPRPLNGRCKCGSQKHKYVNDPNCFLYKDLRLLDKENSEDSKATVSNVTSRALPKKMLGDLNSIEKAFTDRLLRMKSETESEELEAIFVDRMEALQVQACNQAVFAPCLEAIVLSAVVELGLKYKIEEFIPNKSFTKTESKPASVPVTQNDSDDSDSDDDDVPLAMLGAKRPGSKHSPCVEKKMKQDTSIRYDFLAKLFRHISEKWGHVYTEPTHAAYAWRWEVFYGQNSSNGSTWAAESCNPRPVHSRSLENLRFVLDDETIVALEQHRNDESQYSKALTNLAFVMTPQQTGICDELIALLQSDLLRIDETRGIPVLTQDWYTKVDVLLLIDMDEQWGCIADPSGKYGIAPEVRQPLRDHWKPASDGWALVTSTRENNTISHDDDDIIFPYEEIVEWRDAFEQKHQMRTDGMNGIGRFY